MIKIPLQAKFLIVMIFLSLTFISQLKADYLLGHLERCAADYYYKYDDSANKYKLYYLNSRTGNWSGVTTNVGFIQDGYAYDSVTGECRLDDTTLGLSINQYNFIYALVGLIFGLILFWLVPSSKK